MANTVSGTERGDTLIGTNGTDVIVGKGGNDTLNGEGGNDIIIGGSGNDILYGGRGQDTFVFDVASEDGAIDSIYGFYAGAGNDMIDFQLGSGSNVEYVTSADGYLTVRASDIFGSIDVELVGVNNTSDNQKFVGESIL